MPPQFSNPALPRSSSSSSTLPPIPEQTEMSPTSLSSNTVHFTLQYISPPSQLDRPLPSHLLSKPLLQRHHFLDISPENPSEYLSWSSDSSAKAIDLLESRPTSHDDVPPSYPIQYTSDEENTYAHVALPPTGADGEAARLVFLWDTDGWKFHDTKLMPFPSDSSATLPEVLAAHGPATSNVTSVAAPQYNPYGFDQAGDDDGSDDDNYWNAYGAEDDDGHEPRQHQVAKEEVDDSEDAYWAQYSSVHGTADSTIPTPPVVRRRQMYSSDSQDPLPGPAHNGASDTPGVTLSIAPPPQWLHYNPRWGPASPKALARLLAEISPRQSPPQVAAIVADFEDDLELSPPFAGSSDDSDTLSPPDSDVLGLLSGPTTEVETQNEAVAPAEPTTALRAEEPTHDEDEPLKQSLKGLFALWKSSRSQKGVSSEEDLRQSFLRIVETAVGEQ